MHRSGQVAGEVRIVSWVQLGMHENRYLGMHLQVLKSRIYGVYQDDVRDLLGLPVLDNTVQLGAAGATEDSAVLPPDDDDATSQPLDKPLCTGPQGGTEAQGADCDQSCEESDDNSYDMP